MNRSIFGGLIALAIIAVLAIGAAGRRPRAGHGSDEHGGGGAE